MQAQSSKCPALRRTLPAAALLLAAFAPVSQAQQQTVPNVVRLDAEAPEIPRYAVEIIVFEYVGAAASTTENFGPLVLADAVEVVSEDAFFDDPPPVFSDRPEQDLNDLPVAIDPTADAVPVEAAGDDAPFVLLPGETLEQIPTYESAGIEKIDPADFQLRGAWDKLVRLDAYRPLMHTAWIQPTLEKDETAPLALRRIGNPPLRLDGSITLYLSRFLHLVVDLSLEDRSAQRGPVAGEEVRYYGDSRARGSRQFDLPAIRYRIEEDRIVRNNEVRYYDHPKFGVIAQVTRIEDPVPDDLDNTGDLLPGN